MLLRWNNDEEKMTIEPIKANLIISTAEKSYDRKGAFIGAGKETKRIHFEACGENNKMLVAVASPVITSLGNLLKPFTKFKTNPFVITLKIENDKGESRLVDVNIRSLAKRLHISKNELISNSGRDCLESSIVKHFSESKFGDILEQYAAHMEEVPGFKFLSTSKGVMETFKAAVHDEKPSGLHISKSGHTYIWAKSEGPSKRINVVSVEALNAKNKLGEGSNGNVFQSGKNLALKLDKPAEIQEFAALKEAQLLKSLTQTGEIKGIMLPPYAIFFIPPVGEGEWYTGFLNRLLRTTLDKTNDIKHLSNKEIAMGFTQVLNGLDNIHSQKVFHGDIKPGNIGIDQDKCWRLFDFGAAVDMRTTKDENFQQFKLNEGTGEHTPKYCSKHNNTRILDSNNITNYQEALKERDYLGVALSFLETTLGERDVSKMFEYDDEEYIKKMQMSSEDFILKLMDKEYPHDLAYNVYLLIQNCLTDHYKDPQPFLTNFKNSLDKFCDS